MWKLLLLFLATAAANDFEDEPGCRYRMYEECENEEDQPDGLPGTEEELDEFCKFIVKYLDCANRIADSCTETEIDADYFRELAATANRVCDQNSLLYMALAGSLPCFKENEANFTNTCSAMAEEGIGSFSEILASIGITDIVAAPDVEPAECLAVLYRVGCSAAVAGVNCGDIAREVMLDIILGFDTPFSKCNSGIKEIVPQIVEVYQKEIEKEVAVENALKKKK